MKQAWAYAFVHGLSPWGCHNPPIPRHALLGHSGQRFCGLKSNLLYCIYSLGPV